MNDETQITLNLWQRVSQSFQPIKLTRKQFLQLNCCKPFWPIVWGQLASGGYYIYAICELNTGIAGDACERIPRGVWVTESETLPEKWQKCTGFFNA